MSIRAGILGAMVPVVERKADDAHLQSIQRYR
jgi:hypothetical protein